MLGNTWSLFAFVDNGGLYISYGSICMAMW